MRLKCSGMHTFFERQTIISEFFPMRIPAAASPVNCPPVQMQLNLPSHIQQLNNMHSTIGNLIDCVYMIDVGARMDGTCMCC